MLLQALCSISYPLVNSNWSYSQETPNMGQIRRFLEPCDLVIWQMTLKNNRAPLLCSFKICAAFRRHWWIQTGVSQRRPIWVKLDDFYSRVTLKFDRSPWKTIRHLFYASSSFVQHFVPIGEFKLESQSGNAQFGSNWTIFITVWPWNLTDDLEKQYGTSPKQHQAICIISSSYVNSNWSNSPETLNLGQIGRFLEPCDLEIDGWPWKTIGHLSYTTSSFVQHFVLIGEFKLKLQSGNAQSGSNSTIFKTVWPWNLTDDLEKQ